MQIHVINRGLVSPPPAGKYAWMNQHVFVGTVTPGDDPKKPSVRLSIYKLV